MNAESENGIEFNGCSPKFVAEDTALEDTEADDTLELVSFCFLLLGPAVLPLDENMSINVR